MMNEYIHQIYFDYPLYPLTLASQDSQYKWHHAISKLSIVFDKGDMFPRFPTILG